MVFGTQTELRRSSLAWSELRPQLNSPYHRLTPVIDGASSPKIQLSLSMQPYVNPFQLNLVRLGRYALLKS